MNPFDLLLPYQQAIFNDKSRFLILNCSRQIGKSFTIAAMATRDSITKPNTTSIILSVGMRQSSEVMKKCVMWAKAVSVASQSLIRFDYNAESIRFNNGSRIICVPADPSRARGFSGNIYWDECSWTEHADDVFEAVFPTITNEITGNKRFIVSSTPRTYNDLFGRLFNEKNNFSKHKITIHDAANQGLQVNPELLKTTINDDIVFNTEYCCEFLNDSFGAFNLDLVGQYDTLPNGVQWYLGYDVSRSKDDSVICLIGTKDGKYYVDRYVSLRGETFSNQFSTLQQMYRDNNCVAGAIDATGIGAQLAEDAHLKISSKIIEYKYNQNSKLLLFDRLRAMISDGKLLVNKNIVNDVKQDLSQIERVTHNGVFSYIVNRKSDNHADLTNSIALAITSSIENPVSLQTPISYQRHTAFGTYKTRI